MPTEVLESPVVFHFEDTCEFQKYDDGPFFRNAFRLTAGGSKGVDFVCVQGDVCWLIEVKKRIRRVEEEEDADLKNVDLIRVVSEKVRDSLAGLATATVRAEGDEREFARKVFSAGTWRVVLHMEQEDKTSALRRRPVPIPSMRSKLRQRTAVGVVDPKAEVVDMGTWPEAAARLKAPWKTTPEK